MVCLVVLLSLLKNINDYFTGDSLHDGHHGCLDRSVVGELEAQISIPMEAGVESLNAAVALAIVSFEVHRQRTLNDV